MQQEQAQFQVAEFDFLLLLNIPVPIFTEHGEVIKIKTPSLEEYYTNTPLRKLEALFLTNLDEEVVDKPEEIGFIADSLNDVLVGLAISEQNEDILRAFEDITGCSVEKTGINFNGVEITDNDVLEIRAAFLVSTGRLDLEGHEMQKEEDEFDRRMREMEERINKVKKRTNDNQTVSYKEMILLIMYELGSSAEEVKNLNRYGLRELYLLAGSATTDKIQKIAAGNGLLSEEHSYKGILSDK